MSSDIRFTAKAYIDQGWAVVPLVKGEKRAATKWQTQSYSPEDFRAEDGIAGKCGEPSGWRVDVDLDAAEAVAAAKALLPATGLIHGRPGKPDSHYWFRCEGAKSQVWKDVKGSGDMTATLVEIRSTGGYTALPPSGHPSGDILAWTVEREPMAVSSEDLRAAVTRVAIATLLARHWPGPGARHAAVGAIAGFLLKHGVDPLFVVPIVECAARVAGDADLQDRVVFARGTVEKFSTAPDLPLTGGPTLADALGEDVVTRLRAWLGVKDLDALEVMNTKHFWVRLGKDDVIGRELASGAVVFQRPRSLYTEYANQRIQVGTDKKTGEPKLRSVFEAWLEWPGRRDYEEVTFAPPPRTCGPRDYNLWRGFSVQPAAGDCSRFLEHLHTVVCGGRDDYYAYLLDLFALTVQAPGIPSEVAVAFRGGPGAGKGTVVRALGTIFGPHYAHLDSTKHLAGNFNSILSGKVVVFADEAFWAGDKREHGAIKRLITEPTLTIERKGIDAVAEPNAVHLFVAGNENWIAPAMLKERRYFCLDVAGTRMGDHAYFSAIERELYSQQGINALLAMLLDRETSAERVRAVPRTEELRVQQVQSLADELAWWLECLDDGRIGAHGWPDKLASNKLFEAYLAWGEQRRIRRILPKVEFARRLGSLFSEEGTIVVRVAGITERCYRLRTLRDARRVFDLELGTPHTWNDDAPPIQDDVPF